MIARRFDVELHVDPLRGLLGDRAPIPTPALLTSTSRRPQRSRWAATMRCTLGLVGHVARDLLDLEAGVAQPAAALGELLGPARGDGQPVALLAQRARDREADPARGSGDEGARSGICGSFLGASRRRPRGESKHGPPTIDSCRSPSSSCSRSSWACSPSSPTAATSGAAAPPLRPADRPDRGAGRAGARPAVRAAARRSGDARAGARATRPPRSTPTTRRRAGAPTPTCSACSGSCRAGSISARRRVDLRARRWPATTTRARRGCGWSRARRRADRVLYEMTLAHELDHALEDQRFGLRSRVLARGGDPALAYTALVEGSATELMLPLRGARASIRRRPLGGIARLGLPARHRHLPPFLTAQLVFPYTAGRGVRPAAARGRRWLAGGSSTPRCASARRSRRSRSSTPTLYLRVQQPRRVSLRGAGARARGRAGGRSTAPAWGVADRATARAGRRRDVARPPPRAGAATLRALRARRRPRPRRPLALGHAARRDAVPRRAARVGRRRAAGSRAAGPAAWRTADGAAALARPATPSPSCSPRTALARRAPALAFRRAGR